MALFLTMSMSVKGMVKEVKIVLLERNSLGPDIDVSCYEKLGKVDYYEVSNEENSPERIKDADIIIYIGGRNTGCVLFFVLPRF